MTAHHQLLITVALTTREPTNPFCETRRSPAQAKKDELQAHILLLSSMVEKLSAEHQRLRAERDTLSDGASNLHSQHSDAAAQRHAQVHNAKLLWHVIAPSLSRAVTELDCPEGWPLVRGVDTSRSTAPASVCWQRAVDICMSPLVRYASEAGSGLQAASVSLFLTELA